MPPPTGIGRTHHDARISRKPRTTTHPSKPNSPEYTVRDDWTAHKSYLVSDHLKVCVNCDTQDSRKWRQNREGEPLCDACGIFFTLHGIPRPLPMSLSPLGPPSPLPPPPQNPKDLDSAITMERNGLFALAISRFSSNLGTPAPDIGDTVSEHCDSATGNSQDKNNRLDRKEAFIKEEALNDAELEGLPLRSSVPPEAESTELRDVLDMSRDDSLQNPVNSMTSRLSLQEGSNTESLSLSVSDDDMTDENMSEVTDYSDSGSTFNRWPKVTDHTPFRTLRRFAIQVAKMAMAEIIQLRSSEGLSNLHLTTHANASDRISTCPHHGNTLNWQTTNKYDSWNAPIDNESSGVNSKDNAELLATANCTCSILETEGSALFPQLGLPRVNSHAGTSGSSSTSTSSGPRRSTKKNASSKSLGKRPSDGQHPDEDQGEEFNKKPRRNLEGISSVRSSRKFACPFFKRNPENHQRWRSCAGPGWVNVHRVKSVFIGFSICF
jgi:hypothetical protein